MTDTTAIAGSTGGAKPAVNPYVIAMTVSIAAFMEVLDTTITNVSLSHIAGSLGASQDESTWVLTSYLVANGIVLPLSGWLSRVMGRKNFFMMCIAGFTLASFACGIATSLPMLIIFRLVQGLAGGGLQPTQQAIISDSFPPEKRGTAFAITGITMIVAPILGPTLGGWITDNYSWRWIFFMNVPVGILAVFLVNSIVTDPPHAQKQGLRSIDYISLGLVAVGLGALQIVLDKGQEDDWFGSTFILVNALVSAVCLIGAVARLLLQEEPIIDLRLLKIRSFGMSCLTIFFVGFALYGCATLLPLLVQTGFGYDSTLAGLVLSPGGIAIIILMPISGRLVGKIEPRYLVAFGMFMTAVGMYVTAKVTPQVDYRTFVFMRILQVVGLPFLFVPTSALAFSQIPREKSSNASALYSLMRNLGGSFGISILSSYVSRHQQLHQNLLGQYASASGHNYQGVMAHLTSSVNAVGIPQSHASTLAFGRLYHAFLAQVNILAYADAFELVSIITLILAFVSLLMPSIRQGKKPAGAPAAEVPVH